MNELLDVDLPQEEWDTVGGLVFNTLGHVPIEGECLQVDGLEFCAERVQGRRIVSVIITRLAVRRADDARHRRSHRVTAIRERRRIRPASSARGSSRSSAGRTWASRRC